jgi:hypothetical protein
MFEKLLLAATVTFSISLSLGTQTTSFPAIALQEALQDQVVPAQSADFGSVSLSSAAKLDRLKIYLT